MCPQYAYGAYTTVVDPLADSHREKEEVEKKKRRMGMNGKHMICTAFGIFAAVVFLVLACTVPGADTEQKPKWWPLFTLIFYAIAGIPYAFCPVIASGDTDSRNAWLSFGDFLVAVVVTCIFGFPCILLQTQAIQGIHLFFCIISGLCALGTVGYTIHARSDDY